MLPHFYCDKCEKRIESPDHDMVRIGWHVFCKMCANRMVDEFLNEGKE